MEFNSNLNLEKLFDGLDMSAVNEFKDTLSEVSELLRVFPEDFKEITKYAERITSELSQWDGMLNFDPKIFESVYLAISAALGTFWDSMIKQTDFNQKINFESEVDLAPLTDALGKIQIKLDEIKEAIPKDTPGWLKTIFDVIDALGSLASIIGLLKSFLDKLPDFFPLPKGLQELVSGKEGSENIDTLNEKATALRDTLAEIRDILTEISDILDGIPEKLDMITQSAEQTYEDITTYSEDFMNDIAILQEKFLNDFSSLCASCSETLSNTLSSALEMITGTAYEAIELIKGVAQTAQSVFEPLGEYLIHLAKRTMSETSMMLKIWWVNDIAPYFSAERWSAIAQQVSQAFRNSLDFPEIKFDVTFSQYPAWKARIARMLGLFGIPTIKFTMDNNNGYNPSSFGGGSSKGGGGGGSWATGGFPPIGELFLAREAGPELVGSIGCRTAVMNNNQIVESVSNGVYAAQREQNALLREQNNLLRAILNNDSSAKVYLDGKQITATVEKYQRERGVQLVSANLGYKY